MRQKFYFLLASLVLHTLLAQGQITNSIVYDLERVGKF